VATQDAGVASGLLNTSRLVAGALGLALLSTSLPHEPTMRWQAGSGCGAMVDGFHLALYRGAGFALLGALVTLVGLRQARPRGAAQAQAEPAA
jgi:hypothetical protein